ncbi:alanine--tRNA ligase [Candidatus Roizmanbacteria bacterium CG_4_10_14_0_8_um_filter_33_9]|uniref:alanine--tRNA ligase n=1 Tax=Candidatus Roizmanbacteria bacterium CG_4_10_14_0_8_um_filter_33_9 TaxID=1974826 RepID=A0A2M7QJ58_9BACT|nr:MAG: alanine--tRNA ligase [Candidatus Roizmanbacteria bacterium CG_4_10_14_0_8_um_filter_33_9]
MSITHVQLRKLFSDYWSHKEHKEVPPLPLVPPNDPTTLFTGSGMQQLVPNLLGEPHPLGKKLYNIQPCFRSQDIEEVGDNRHTTFFEMMGNWSLGTYFKKEQIKWIWEFLTRELKLPKEKLYITVFKGTKEIPADEESYNIWKQLGIPTTNIFKYEGNWWSRAGAPNQMPPGEPGGPDSEVFYEFTQIKHDPKFGEKCHPNCVCGRFLEIGNSVFMQYKKNLDGSFSELPAKNVDFGGGLERILAALNDDPDLFVTDLFKKTINTIEKYSNKLYSSIEYKAKIRVIADHIKGACFMVRAGIVPSNKEQGYVMRRLIRRAVVKMMELNITPLKALETICTEIINIYNTVYFKEDDLIKLRSIIGKEINSFEKTVYRGTKILQNQSSISGKILFDLKQSYGFPVELALELLEQWNKPVNKITLLQEYMEEFKKHKELSRSSSTNKFKGGLADNSEQTLKYHTATHLLHQALFNVLGDDVRQEGSNITGERLRFDFYLSRKPTEDEITKVQTIMNNKIQEELSVTYKIIPKQEALQLGAKSFFREKYPDMVKVYYIGNFSKEFCGGPHVTNTKEIGIISIYKFEKIGNNIYRIYAK